MVQEDLNSLVCTVCTDLDCVNAGNTEHLWCKISTKDGTNMIVIGLIYRSPSNNHEDYSKLNNLFILQNNEQLRDNFWFWATSFIQIYDGI